MNGQIAQLCALACHANHVLSGQPLPNGFEANSTFRYCEFVRFFRRMPVVRIVSEVAATPAEWIRGLARQSSKSVLLVAVPRDDPSLPEHVAVAYAGGIRWALVVTGAEGSPTTWSSKWEVGDRDREDKRIWRVEYLAGSESLAVDNPALADAQQEPDRSLDAALELARDNAWDYWADRLAAAKRQLSGTPEQVFTLTSPLTAFWTKTLRS